MPTVYPGVIDTLTNPNSASGDTLASVPHDEQHATANDAIEALETKVGTGASVPTTAGHVLRVTGAGATAYGAIADGDLPATIARDSEVSVKVDKTGGGNETFQDHGNLGATEIIDLANGNSHAGTLDANCTFTFTGATAGAECSFLLELTQDGTGGRTVAFPASVVNGGLLAAQIDGTASATTVYVFRSRDGGVTWYGARMSTEPLHNYDATAAPTVNDDSGDGYSVGSRWINTASGKEYVCVDASPGAASWTETTVGAASVTFVGAKAYNSTTQSINTITAAMAALDSEEYDSDGFHSTVTNNSRMTIPTGKAGKYLLQAGTFSNSHAGTSLSNLGFVKNGTTNIRSFKNCPAGTSWYDVTQAVVQLAEADYVEFRIYNASTGSNTFGHASAIDAQTWFAVTLLGA